MIGICFGSFMAGLLGPIIIGKIFSQTGSYQLAFVVAIIFSAIGLGLTFVYNGLQKKQITQ